VSTEERRQRLESDLQSLNELKEASTIFDFESSGEPPDTYVLVFRGRGIRRDRTAENGVADVDEHRCELRLPHGYPDKPPTLRWNTPTYHPNVTYSGFVALRDLGLPWEKDLGLDAVCERLWDVARFAHIDLENAANFNAKNWITDECTAELPTDDRPLRDTKASAGGNVIRYQRRGEGGVKTPPVVKAAEPADPSEGVFFIGEDHGKSTRAANDGDGIVFLGDD
jgi:ubiquitin-protein ligase